MAIGIILLTLLAATPVWAATFEKLGEPCHARNILAARLVRDRKSDREWFVLSNTNENSHMELIFVDFERDTAQVFHAPAGAGAWALSEVSGDRLVVGTHYDGRFMIFDLNKMEFVQTVAFPGESYIWNVAMGSDRRIYGGTYPGAKLGALDLNTYQVEDCGAPSPPNLYLRLVSSLPDGRILCAFGEEKPTTLIYGPASNKFEAAPKQLEGVRQGIAWNGYFLAGSRAFLGNTLEEVKPPFPLPPADKGAWSVDGSMTTDQSLFLRQGNAIYGYRKGEKALSLIADLDWHGCHPLVVSKHGDVLGIRGQDYSVVKPGDKQVHLLRIPGESSPRPMLFLEVDPRGRLWGGPDFGQTLFWMDPRSKRVVNTSNICDAGGEVYDVAFCRGKVYAASYAGGDIVEYDPDQPWDQWNHKNPRVIIRLGTRGYIRPTAGIIVGPDGKLYSGWMAKYGAYGGAVAVTDPATGETDLIENPLGQQAVAGLVVDDRFAYVGTSLGANGLPNKQGEPPQFGVIELATKKVVFRRPFEGASNVRVFAYDPQSKRVAIAVNGKVHLFDTTARKFVELANELPPLGSNSVSAVRDGKCYYGSGKSVAALELPSGIAQVLAEAPDRISNVTAGPDGAVYLSCGPAVYCLRSDAKQT